MATYTTNLDINDYWKRKMFVLITGASRGIGRAMAEKIAQLVAPESLLLLISRDEDQLMLVKKAIQEHSAVNVQIAAADLSICSEDTLSSILSATMGDFGINSTSFSHAICIHNAGSLGNISKRIADLCETDECVDYFRLNLVSVIVLNGLFIKMLPETSKSVINISSLCGIQPFASMSLYCTGKAARDMFFKVLAVEEPSIRVLNYAPGPVDTEMRAQIFDQTWDASLAENLKIGSALTPQETVNRLVHLLAQDRFQSGSHVDYFDPIID